MEREIKFRAKKLNSNKWLYFDMISECTNESGEPSEFMQYVLNKETIGQFTGLKDKNGVEVYEDDIFKINNKYYFIQYIEDRCRYVLTTGKGYDSKNCIDLDCDEIFGYAIIGNIHENPELL